MTSGGPMPWLCTVVGDLLVQADMHQVTGPQTALGQAMDKPGGCRGQGSAKPLRLAATAEWAVWEGG